MQSPSESKLPFVGIEAKTMFVPGKKASWTGGRLRILGASEIGDCYHLMSRTAGGDHLLSDIEKEAFRKLMWKMADFLGVRVLTYAVMANHFHILLEVPNREQRFEGAKGEEALMRHLLGFYGKGYVASLGCELKLLRGAVGTRACGGAFGSYQAALLRSLDLRQGAQGALYALVQQAPRPQGDAVDGSLQECSRRGW
jgi:hypothetical protein